MLVASTKPPAGLGPAGRALWRRIHEDYDLAEHERRLLVEASRTADTLDMLDAAVRRDGLIGGDGRVHPAAVEARQQRVVLTRLVASLRVPDEEEQRPQRRGAARSPYRPRVVS